MKIFSELQRVTRILKEYSGQWALCGGVAASIYRNTPRFTNDIDFALIDSKEISAKEIAETVINNLGYKLYQGFIPNANKEKKIVNGLICARSENENEHFIGFDFLLPKYSWVNTAVNLAQRNKINFGFDNLPTITPESLIIAKLVALTNNRERYQDMDDIKEIINNLKIDFDYIKKELKDMNVELEEGLIKLIS